VGFVVDKVALGQVFACQFHSTGAPLLGKGQKIIIIFINKPHGCTASVASAAGPFTSKKKNHMSYTFHFAAQQDGTQNGTRKFITCTYLYGEIPSLQSAVHADQRPVIFR
jgi:hypothetical protein